MTGLPSNEGKTPKRYNSCLDFIKGLACVFVVFMHCEFPGTFGTIVQAISRFCVPFFFMVSGYYCFNPERSLTRSDFKRKITHVGWIVIWSSLFYLAWLLIQHYLFGGKSISITLPSIAALLLLNLPIGISSHLWFLFALLYVYVFYSLLVHFRITRIVYPLAICLFVVYFMLAQGGYFLGFDVPNCVYRNWLIEGFPFFAAGIWIHEHEADIHLGEKQLIAIIVLSSFLCLLERYLMGRDFGVNLFTLPQVFALFIYAIKNPDKHADTLSQRVGKSCSMLVYVLHIFVWQLLIKLYKALGINESITAGYFMPILVVVLSVVLALVINRIKDNRVVKSSIPS